MRLSLHAQPALAIMLALALAPGCQILGVGKQQERLAQLPLIQGHVDLEREAAGPIIVVLARRRADTGECRKDFEIIDHFVLENPGAFVFGVADGHYLVGAFQDRNVDLHFDPGEPALRLCGSQEIVIDVGEVVAGIELLIPAEGLVEDVERVDIVGLEQAREAREQGLVTFRQLIVYGDVVPLGDARFDPANGPKGLWKPADFLIDVRPGVYFLEPYDPDRIPVLFIHGIAGHPREFESLVEQLDSDHFQPWFYFYPSGLSLEGIAAKLVDILAELKLRHRYRRLALVAHSMGGLVGRSFLVQRAAAIRDRSIPLFVSISSPFAGMESAQSGAEHSPIALPASFSDVASGSAFLADLLYLDPETRERPRPLPDGTQHHMIFGFRRQSSRLGESSDKTVNVSSQLQPAVQGLASSIFGIDADHTGILRERETAARLNLLLAPMLD